MINAYIRKLNMMLCILFILCMCGCGNETIAMEEKPIETGFAVPKVGVYDCEDYEAVVVSINKEDKTCTLYNKIKKRNYTLNYDGTTKIYDKYGSSLVIDQIRPGEIVDVTFLKSKKLLNSMAKSASIWVYSEISQFDIDSLIKRVTLPDGEYRFFDDIHIFSDDKEAQVIDINNSDKLIIAGKDRDIYSIIIDEGHGYLRLKGQKFFEGGWIEIGDRIVKTVDSDMIISVPVGTYDVKLSKGSYEGKRTVTIKKNSETELDVSDMVIADTTMYGTVVLVTSPMDAEVYIDGIIADTTKPIELEYGIHQIMVRAENYETLTQYIKVGQESATLEINLDKNRFSDKNEDSSPSPAPIITSVVTQAISPVETPQYRVKVEAPESVELYVDGSYVGVVPTDFAKTEGTHTITLRKEGYVTRSYTIRLDSLLQNETFSFASLASIDGEKKIENDQSSNDNQTEEHDINNSNESSDNESENEPENDDSGEDDEQENDDEDE